MAARVSEPDLYQPLYIVAAQLQRRALSPIDLTGALSARIERLDPVAECSRTRRRRVGRVYAFTLSKYWRRRSLQDGSDPGELGSSDVALALSSRRC
jgi:hypothetical protein